MGCTITISDVKIETHFRVGVTKGKNGKYFDVIYMDILSREFEGQWMKYMGFIIREVKESDAYETASVHVSSW